MTRSHPTSSDDRFLRTLALRLSFHLSQHVKIFLTNVIIFANSCKVGDAPKRPIANCPDQPLSGIRVLDLTRVLAGPICGRTLAGHGADVLFITSPTLPALPFLDKDTSRGKRTAQLDLAHAADREKLAELVEDADVFLQAYRPGGLRDKGFGVGDVAKLKPGIVYASLNAYGWDGPWSSRRGFDSLVQNATGFGHAEGQALSEFQGTGATQSFSPQALPCQCIDHGAGQLLAYGINAALCKTITEGGTWEVRVSLAAVGQWIRSFGQVSGEAAFGGGLEMPSRSIPMADEIAHLSAETTIRNPTKRGRTLEEPEASRMSVLRHAAELSLTPVQVGEVPVDLNADEPVWLARLS